MEKISCIFCGRQSNHIAITENGYTGRKCHDCNLIFISPRPDVDEVIHLYTDKHAVQYADAQFQFDKVKRMEAASTISRIKRYRQRGSILELGPGGGYFLLEAQKKGYEPHGIELNPIEYQWINDNLHIPCENMALNKDSFGGMQFDIIYHKDVLSHLHNPIQTFMDINRALKKDGILVFGTGNIADISESYYKFFQQFYYPDHLFFFGEKSLNILLERTGFNMSDIFREAVFFQLLLEKALLGFRNTLEDKSIVENLKSMETEDVRGARVSVKRRLRLLYRYASYYLVRLGIVLPKKGWPLNLLVIAEKKSE